VNPHNPSGQAFNLSLIRRILSYVRPYKRDFWLSMILTVLLAGLNPLKPVMFQYMLDHQVPAGDIPGLRLSVMLIIGIIIIQTFIYYAQNLLTNSLAQRIMRDIRVKVYAHIVRLRLKFFDKTPVGALQTRTISDVETLNDVFSQGLVTILGEMLQLIAILGVMFYTDWKLSLVVLTTLPLMLVATYIFKEKVKASFQDVRKYVSELNSFLQEHISGMAIIQIFGREQTEEAKFKEINAQHRNANFRSILYYSVFFPVVEIISALAIALLLWYGAGKIADGQLSFGQLVAFLMYISLFFRPIRMLADQFNTLQMGMVSANRVFNILDTEEFIPDTGTLGAKDVPMDGPVEIEFQEVRFAYNEPEWVLKGISFTTPPGTTTAIVGATGSGKTTVINLLSRFYDLNSGQILVNGIPTTAYKLSWLRSRIVTVQQDVFLFSGSIADNITLNNPDISKEAVIQAAKDVGAHHFIMQLPGDYDYKVKERGATLSTGQRQLISFARALVYNPSVLVLDEATSSIDTETEQLIQNATERIMKGRTSIIIAHRLSTIQQADQILVMHKGEIAERGTHQELLRQNGMYRKLYEYQYGRATA
jgi:ATP-binding cassette, subfamily B, multidrug efflux pump